MAPPSPMSRVRVAPAVNLSPPGSPGPQIAIGAGEGEVIMGAKEIIALQKKEITRMLLKGRAYGSPGSGGTFTSNFWYWSCNAHPVLSVYQAHELHPFSRRERSVVLLCYLAWAFFISTIFYNAFHENTETCNAGCENEVYHTLSSSSSSELFCGPESGEEPETTVADYEKACKNTFEWYILSIFIALCTVPYNMILKVFAQCGCVQECWSCVRCLFECIGGFILLLFSLLSIVFILTGIVLSVEMGTPGVAIGWVTGVVESWFYWPIIWVGVFAHKFKKDKADFNAQHPGEEALAWPLTVESLPMYETRITDDGRVYVYTSLRAEHDRKEGVEGGEASPGGLKPPPSLTLPSPLGSAGPMSRPQSPHTPQVTPQGGGNNNSTTPVAQQMYHQQQQQAQAFTPLVTQPPTQPRQPVMIQVMVPQGAGPGATIQAQAPNGTLVNVLLPANVSPGMVINVAV